MPNKPEANAAEFLRREDEQKRRFMLILCGIIIPATLIQAFVRLGAGNVSTASFSLLICSTAVVAIVMILRRKIIPAAHMLMVVSCVVTAANQFLTSSASVGPVINAFTIFIAASYVLPLKWSVLYGGFSLIRVVALKALVDTGLVERRVILIPTAEWYAGVLPACAIFVFIIVATRRNNERLLHAYRRAAEIRTRFLSRMSHEIRTPLNGVLGISEILAEKNRDPQQAEYLGIIMNSGRHLLYVVNQVLELSRTENRSELLREDYEPASLLRQVTDLFQVELARKRLHLTTVIAPDVPAWISGDAGSVRQILTNLVHNAVKFTDHGEIRIMVSRNAGRIRYAVSDTGLGIPPEKAAVVFNAFEQGDFSTPAGSGVGLGLAICRELCGHMDGRIELESTYGKGSTFHVDLPLYEATGSRPATHGNEEPSVSAARILYAEDDEINQILMRALLNLPGVQLDIVSNGRAAFEAYKQSEDYDLVLMDLHMPEMDGYEALRAIRQYESSTGRPVTPVIAVSASVIAEEVQSALENGFALHVSKPVSKAALFEAIRTVT